MPSVAYDMVWGEDRVRCVGSHDPVKFSLKNVEKQRAYHSQPRPGGQDHRLQVPSLLVWLIYFILSFEKSIDL